LIQFAPHRARELNLPLLTTEIETSEKKKVYDGEIESVGSNALFEYTDAGGGMTDGIYIIKNPNILLDIP
jgi:hypothetical protein